VTIVTVVTAPASGGKAQATLRCVINRLTWKKAGSRSTDLVVSWLQASRKPPPSDDDV